MKEEDKNNRTRLSDFLRYSEGKMTNEERNAFERELQKDPFAEEAEEGFSDLLHGEAEKDLQLLAKRLEKRKPERSRLLFYRIAASVAVLMILSSVYIVIERTSPSSRELSKNAEPKTEVVTGEAEKIAAPETAGKKGQESLPEIRTGKEPSQPAEDRMVAQRSPDGKRKSEVVNQIPSQVREVEAADEKVAVNFKAEDKMAAPAAAVAVNELQDFQVRGKIVSADDNHPLAGASVMVKGTNIGAITDTSGKFNITITDNAAPTLVADYMGMESKEFQAKKDTDVQIMLQPSMVALNQAVVTGFGEAKRSKAAAGAGKAESVKPDYIPPQPVDGKDKYDSYIEENLRTPAILGEGEKADVIIRFIVKSSGKIDSIKILKSPGKDFSDEAIRVIKDGPEWKPAESAGKLIDSEVRLTIVFK